MDSIGTSPSKPGKADDEECRSEEDVEESERVELIPLPSEPEPNREYVAETTTNVVAETKSEDAGVGAAAACFVEEARVALKQFNLKGDEAEEELPAAAADGCPGTSQDCRCNAFLKLKPLPVNPSPADKAAGAVGLTDEEKAKGTSVPAAVPLYSDEKTVVFGTDAKRDDIVKAIAGGKRRKEAMLGSYTRKHILNQFWPFGKEVHTTDLNDPHAYATDLFAYACCHEREPKERFQDLGEAVVYMFHHGDFFERLCFILKYDCYLALCAQSKDIENLTDEEIVFFIHTFRHGPKNCFGQGVFGEKSHGLVHGVMGVVQGHEVLAVSEHEARQRMIVQDFLLSLTSWLQCAVLHAYRHDNVLVSELSGLRQFFPSLKCVCATAMNCGITLEAAGKHKEAVFKFRDAVFAAQARPRAAVAGEESGSSGSLSPSDCCSSESGGGGGGGDDDNDDDLCWFACNEDSLEEKENEVLAMELQLRCTLNLFKDAAFDRSAVKASYMIDWMTSYCACNQTGYFAVTYPHLYESFLLYFCKAQFCLGNHIRLQMGCNSAISQFMRCKKDMILDKSFFRVREDYYSRRIHLHGMDHGGLLEAGCEVTSEDEADMRLDYAAATIIVDLQASQAKVLSDQKIAVPNFSMAYRIAKEGDLIYLTPGHHELTKTSSIPFVMSKNVIIAGEHPGLVTLKGCLLKESDGHLIFKRLTLIIGEPNEKGGSFLVTNGNLTLIQCYVNCYSSLGLRVVSLEANEVQLRMDFCVMTGMQEQCKYFVLLEGINANMFVDSCYCSNAYTFVSNKYNERRHGIVKIINSIFVEMQNGIVLMVSHRSNLKTIIEGCHFRLTSIHSCTYPAIGMAQTGGTTDLSCNFFHLQSHCGYETAVSLHSLDVAIVDKNCIVSSEEGGVSRTAFVCQGVMISETLHAYVTAIEISGMRIGIKITNLLPNQDNYIAIKNSTVSECSVAVQVDDFHVERPAAATAAGSRRRGSNDDDRPNNVTVEMRKCVVKRCYHGVWNRVHTARVVATDNNFLDVPNPIVMTKLRMGGTVKLRANDYTLSKANRGIDEDVDTDEKVKGYRKKLYESLASHGRVPKRIRFVDKKDVLVLTFASDELSYATKYGVHPTFKKPFTKSGGGDEDDDGNRRPPLYARSRRTKTVSVARKSN